MKPIQYDQGRQQGDRAGVERTRRRQDCGPHDGEAFTLELNGKPMEGMGRVT